MKTLILALHGIGNQRAGWSNALEDGVRRYTLPDAEIRWAEVSYADMNGLVTDELWRKITAKAAMERANPTPLRRFVFSHLSDALRMDEYQERAFARLDREMVEYAHRIIVLSHSLGTVLAVRWLESRKLRVDGLVTLGSPLPLFQDPIPGESLTTRWVNCYDPLDPIGCPLLPSGYPVHDDVAVRNRGRWVPVLRHLNAHVNYDRNRYVHRRIAELI